METVTIFEVGPRDGLQSLPHSISTTSKIALINALSKTGLRKIEATSFVNPAWIPQLADAAEVMSGIAIEQGVTYAALTPNLKGVEAAISAGCREVAVFISASEGFSRANLNCSIGDSIAKIRPAIQRALDENIAVRGYLSCVFECPFDGPIAPVTVARLTEKLLELGCYEVSLGDTIGSANPDTTKRLLETITRRIQPSQIAGHFHDTRGLALSNIERSLDFGVRTFDCSIAGLGGCPYAPGASGNVDTRSVIERLQCLGFETGVDLKNISKAEVIARDIALQHE